MENKDKILICKECGEDFDFTVGEQEFYAEKDFVEPIRCKDCRDKRKSARNTYRDEETKERE
jgi:hypothetical protein